MYMGEVTYIRSLQGFWYLNRFICWPLLFERPLFCNSRILTLLNNSGPRRSGILQSSVGLCSAVWLAACADSTQSCPAWFSLCQHCCCGVWVEFLSCNPRQNVLTCITILQNIISHTHHTVPPDDPKMIFHPPPSLGSMLVLQSGVQLNNFDRNWLLTNIEWGCRGDVSTIMSGIVGGSVKFLKFESLCLTMH